VLRNGYATTASDVRQQSVQSFNPTRFIMKRNGAVVAYPAFLDGSGFEVLTR
jgi:hypothetical protein